MRVTHSGQEQKRRSLLPLACRRAHSIDKHTVCSVKRQNNSNDHQLARLWEAIIWSIKRDQSVSQETINSRVACDTCNPICRALQLPACPQSAACSRPANALAPGDLHAASTAAYSTLGQDGQTARLISCCGPAKDPLDPRKGTNSP